MKRSTKTALLSGGALLTAGLLLAEHARQNKSRKTAAFDTTRILLRCPGLPQAFDGFRIAMLSDLHGNRLPGLEQTIRDYGPDLIACTGDIYDGVQHAARTEAWLNSLQTIAPVCFVSGNHEFYAGNWKRRSESLKKQGIHVLDNECITLRRNGQTIEICGLADPDLKASWSYERRLEELLNGLKKLPPKRSWRLLLFHRADLFEQISSADADLTLSGHLHGGHWRLFGHGLFAPNDGNGRSLFPTYDSGLYTTEEGHMLYVSRGLGDQMALPRLMNPPELVFLSLKAECGREETLQSAV